MSGATVSAIENVELTTGALTVERFGTAQPLVLVHPDDGTVFLQPLIDALAAHRGVHLVHLPGWGVTPGSENIQGVDDLALLVGEYIDHEFDQPVPAVGISFGAWVLAEAAVYSPSAFSQLVLVAPVGIKTNGREERSFVDVYATDPDELRRHLYGDPAYMPNLRELDDAAFTRLAYASEAVARHGWAPYLHDPKLPHRLARIACPTLVVTGGADKFVMQSGYGDQWAELIGGAARHDELPGVGHRIEEEAVAELARRTIEFLDPN